MEFLGNKWGYVYLRLWDVIFLDEGIENLWRFVYIQFLGIMCCFFRVCNLVYVDLSEYNIFYDKNKLYIIDVLQLVEYEYLCVFEFLCMDIKNVGDFFCCKGVDIFQDCVIFDFIMVIDGFVEELEFFEVIE